MASRKRQRVVDSADYIHCTIIGPKEGVTLGPLFETEAAWPTYTISFPRSGNPSFFSLWSKLTSVMLYIEDEKEPFTDFDRPLSELEDIEFRMGDWTEPYFDLRETLAMMCDEKAISNLNADIKQLSQQIKQKEDRRTSLAAKVAARKRQMCARRNLKELN